MHRLRPALVDLEARERVHRYLGEVGISTDRFVVQEAVGAHKRVEVIHPTAGAQVEQVRQLVAWPTHPSDDWCKGFLAGTFDAGGSGHGRGLRITNGDPAILRRLESCMQRFRFAHRREPSASDGVAAIRLLGGLVERQRFLHTVDPAITRKRSFDGLAVKPGVASRRVVAIEPMGIDLPMFDITTGTGDFIANGVVSHNCFARPTHDYLGLDIGRDFDTKIVVKVNAVERVRHETAPARWAGEPIAMGTNTDPYQPAEGRYKLTRGVMEVLTERGNPFSVLTKSTLVLRDRDVLAAAAAATDVAVDFSIGTLDEEVWRITEPGAPHPRRRIEAVRRLNDAGIPTGVLMGPVLPGMSDDEERLEAVVRAALEAGAVRIGAVLLHLKPGLRDHYLTFLEETRPDLVAMHRRRYASRAYAPRSAQQQLTAMVQRLIAANGGLRSRPRPRPPSRPRPEARGAEQLSLGW